jgi:SPOR domain
MLKRALKSGLCAMLLCAAISTNASAETVFMVQLGTFDSQEKAQQHWVGLSDKYPQLFDELRYKPNEIVSKPDNFISYRTQAGPIPTRAEAEKLCETLQTSNTECYVVETAMFFAEDEQINEKKPEQAVNVVTAPQETPALQAEAAAPSDIAAFSFDEGDDVPTESSADTAYDQDAAPMPTLPEQAVASNQTLAVEEVPVAGIAQPVAGSARGNIAVAEAIAVPLSEQSKQNPYLERGNRLMDAHPSSSERVNSYWADISYFNNEADAMRYVKLLKNRDNQLPPKLRIRITRPYGKVNDVRKLSLRMGPFMTTRPIRRLCALTRGENLRCRAIKDIGGSVRNQDVLTNRREGTRASSTPTRYGQYRKDAAQSARGAASAPVAYGNYYVQLGSFLSPVAAEEKWAQLSAQHSGVLRSEQKDIASPNRGSSSSRLFRLRTGPYNGYSAANAVCDRLKAQGTLCLVVKR